MMAKITCGSGGQEARKTGRLCDTCLAYRHGLPDSATQSVPPDNSFLPHKR